MDARAEIYDYGITRSQDTEDRVKGVLCKTTLNLLQLLQLGSHLILLFNH